MNRGEMMERSNDKSQRRNRGRIVGIFSPILLLGCMVGPDYAAPETPMPDAWHAPLAEGLKSGSSPLQSWWQVFQDPMLDSLVDRARMGNLELKLAASRVLEARHHLGATTGQILPDAVAGGAYSRSRASENGPVPLPPGIDIEPTNFHSLGVDSFWEIDLFGRIRRSIESASANAEASVEDYRDALVVLYAETALAYFELRTFQERLRVALKNVESQRESLDLTRERVKAELAPALDEAQAELNLSSSEAALPALRLGISRAQNRLAVLLGVHPGTLNGELGESNPLPSPPDELLVGLPAELLRQRPDVRAAERRIASQNALIGVATADLYPQFSLTGSIGFEATDLSDLFTASSRSWSFGPAVRWNLFSGGRIRSRIRIEEARTEQAYLGYERTVLGALEEVENALQAYVQDRIRRDSLEKAVEAARRSATLVRDLYKTGNTNFLNVLDAQRSLFSLEDRLAVVQGQVARNLVLLYKALGGGWATPAPGEGKDGEDR